MDAPPFRLARSPSGKQDSTRLHPLRDLCCDAPSALSAASKRPVAPRRRATLAELDVNIHCSVIGTCLSTSGLRKLVPRFTTLDREHATDLQIHHAAVELASAGGAGAKALHKALDDRFERTIRHFSAVKDDDGLRALWAQALKTGDVPPAYWAVMTHPATTLELRHLAFGDVHMLSHLVGAANRADIRRLVALEEENAMLRHKVERQQGRLHEMATLRDAAVRELERVGMPAAPAGSQPSAPGNDLAAEVARLRDALAERDERVALHTSRREVAEQRLRDEQQHARALQTDLDDALATLRLMQQEAAAMEQVVVRAMHPVTGTPAGRPGLERLQGQRIVYVGGRPGSHAVLTRLVESAGGRLVVHDGGVEDRKGLLATLLPGADMVVFPVDCIDHDSMNTLKRVCDRHQIAYYPLRTASVASFMELLARDRSADAAPVGDRPVSAFCLRHG